MFKSLLRTIPSLSGNVKLLCHIKPDTDISGSFERVSSAVCHVDSVSLYPVSSSVSRGGIRVNMLSDTYDWNLKDFYSIYKDTFYSSQYRYDKDEIEKIDYTKEAGERDKAFEFGCSRSKYSVYGTQFEFFAPIYVDTVDDIPSEFVVTLHIDNGIYKIRSKKIHIRLRDAVKDGDGVDVPFKTSRKSTILQYNTNKMFDYLYRYIYNMNSSGMFGNCIAFNYTEQSKELNDSNAVYYGIDLLRGGYTSATDTPVNALYYNAVTINSFDDTVTGGFSRHNMVMWQIIPLCFSFNIEDIMTKDELKLVNFSKITFSGRYVFDDCPYEAENTGGELYDFSINYSDYYTPSVVYDKKNCMVKSTVSYGDETDNVMNQSFPALNEKLYWKYRFMNKIKPNTTRWIMQQSGGGISNGTDKFPYIINNNIAFSIPLGSSLKYFPVPQPESITKNIISSVYSSKLSETRTEEYINIVIPNDKTATVDAGEGIKDSIYNYDYYRYFNSNTANSYNGQNDIYAEYVSAVKSNGNLLSNILYLTNDFYNKETEGGQTIMEYICNINNDISLNDVINGLSVFSGAELSYSPTHFVDIFDKSNDDYCNLWATPVNGSAWYNDCLFDFNILYNKKLTVSQLQAEYSEAIFDGKSNEAMTADEVAATNCIYDYINDKSFENFKKTKRITKFGVFMFPVVSIAETGTNIFSADDVMVFTSAAADELVSYSNLLKPAEYGDLYDAGRISNTGNGFNVIMDEPNLYTKKEVGFNLFDIMADEENIAYIKENNRVSYTMSSSFAYNQSYQNIYVSSYELISNINNNILHYRSIFPTGTDLYMPDTNMYFSYTELCNAYSSSNDNADKKSLLYSLMQSEKISSYSFVNVANLNKLTAGNSNVLAYEWTKAGQTATEQKTLSYLYNIIYQDNASAGTRQNMFNDIPVVDVGNNKLSALIDGGNSYIQDAHFTLYDKTLYNKDEFVSAAYWMKYSAYATDKKIKQLLSYVTEYRFTPKYENFSGETVFTNLMQPKTAESSSKYNEYVENIKYDDNVLWADTFNMYELLAKHGLVENGMSRDAIWLLCDYWRGNNIIKELFCSFISKQNLLLNLSSLFLGMDRTVPLYEITRGAGEIQYWNEDKCVRYSTVAGVGDISFSVNDFSAYYKTTYQTSYGETEYVGGPFYNLFVCTKCAVVDADTRLRPKYRYIRFGKYVEDAVTAYIEENASNDWLIPGIKVGEINVRKTVETLLKSINCSYLSIYIEETEVGGVFSLPLKFDVYGGDNNRIISAEQVAFRLDNIFLVCRKDFIRVDEYIMEYMFSLSDDQTYTNNTDLYFVSPLYDFAFDSKMDSTSVLYNILEDVKYSEEADMYSSSPYTGGNLPVYYDDIIYRHSDESNFTPLYSSVYIQNKDITAVYIQSALNNIKKCRVNYGTRSPFIPGQSTINYRYNMSDLSTLIKVNTDVMNSILNMLNLNVNKECNNYDLYKTVFEKALKNITVYSNYTRNSRYLLSPVPNGKYDALGFSSQNMFTVTRDGENYGFYVVGCLFDNTKATFSRITSINTVKIDRTGDNAKIVFSGVNNNNKLFHSVDNMPLLTASATSDTGGKTVHTVSLDGVQYYCSCANKLLPFIKENVLKNILNVDTLVEQKITKQSVHYYTTELNVNAVNEKNISFTAERTNTNSINGISTIKTQQLLRYWTYASPCFEKVSEMQKNSIFNYIYNTKRKDDDNTLIKTGKYPSIGDFVVDQATETTSKKFNGSTVTDINKYTGINIYSTSDVTGINSYNNKTTENYKEPEYKHFNVSVFFQLPAEFVITDNKRYIYNDVLEMSADAKKKQIFKSYVYNYINNKYRTGNGYADSFISITDILFLYNRYNVKIESNSVGLNNKNERIYTVVYRFSLL